MRGVAITTSGHGHSEALPSRVWQRRLLAPGYHIVPRPLHAASPRGLSSWPVRAACCASLQRQSEGRAPRGTRPHRQWGCGPVGVGDDHIGKAHLAPALEGSLLGPRLGRSRHRPPETLPGRPRRTSLQGARSVASPGACDEAEYRQLLPASVSPLSGSLPPASLRQ